MYPSDCLCIIACGKNKTPGRSKAADLYIGTSFVVRRNFAKNNFINWCILSAKHSILLPQQVVEPYDVNMKDLSEEERHELFERALQVIQNSFPSCNKFYLILPSPYDQIADYLRPLGEVIFPLEGLQGRQALHYLKTGNRQQVDVDEVLSKVCAQLVPGQAYLRKTLLTMLKEQLPAYSPTYFKRILNSSTIDGEGEKGLRFRRIFERHDDLYYLADSYVESSGTRRRKLF